VGQDRPLTILISTTVNGKPLNSNDLKIKVRVDHRILTLSVTNGRFTVDLQKHRENARDVALTIAYKKYIVTFAELTAGHFQGEWKVMFSKPTFPSEDIPNPDKVDFVCGIEFRNSEPGTVITQIKYK